MIRLISCLFVILTLTHYPCLASTNCGSAACDAVSPKPVTINAGELTTKGAPAGVKTLTVRNVDGEIHIYLANLLSKGWSVPLKIDGLREELYGLYVDGKYLGGRTRQQLEDGIPVTLPEHVVPDWQLNYIRTVRDNAESTIPLFKNGGIYQTGIVYDALNDVRKHTNSMLIGVQKWESAKLILTPNDGVVRQGSGMEVPEPAKQIELVNTNMLYINRIRKTIWSGTAPGEIRNIALSAVTPVIAKLEMPAKITPGFKFVAKVSITNTIDKPITATPVFPGAPGWVLKPKKAATVKDLAPTKTAVIEYWAKAPEDISQLAARPSLVLDLSITGTNYQFNLVPLPKAEPKKTE